MAGVDDRTVFPERIEPGRTLAGRDEIRRFGADFFGTVEEDSTAYVELSVERDGRLVILYTANPNFMD